MKKFVVYMRVSTKRQGDSGLGLDGQKRDIWLYLDHYYPGAYLVLKEFVEVCSAKSEGNRPMLQEALELCRQEGAILVVDKLDRLSRRVAYIATLMEDKKVKFKVASIPNADNMQLHIYAVMAEKEREFISIRVTSALKEAKKRGVKLGQTESGRHTKKLNAFTFYNGLGKTFLNILEKCKGSNRMAARELTRLKIPTSQGKTEWTSTQVRRAIASIEEFKQL